jgi:hypothetical protein
MAKSDIESLALKVFSFILTKVETVKGPWEFFREQQFVDSIASEDTTYFRGCSCKFLISFLRNEDPHLYEQSLGDNGHDFKTCFRCMYNYWSSDFLSQYENVDFRSDILNLRDKVNNIERYVHQIKVNNEADARYSTNIVKGCLKEAGLKVVALEGRQFLELVRQGQGSSAIDHLKLNKVDLLILLCYSMSNTETFSLTQVSDKLDGISVNTLIIACEDMKGKHGVFIDKPTVSWENLTDQSKAHLLRHKMNLQGRTLVLGEYLQQLDTGSLRMVLSDSQGKLNIPVGPNSEQSKLPQPYIHRKFQEINSKKEIPDTDITLMNNKLVLISDGPGAGKSTVLIQLFQTLSGFDGLWGHVIYLNRFLNSLLEWEASSVPVGTLLFEMLKANLQNGELQRLFETTMEGNTSLKLVLFLDALDEVAPDSYDNVTNILKQLMDKPGLSEIVLNTRPHLFTELQKSFEQTTIFLKFVPISHREQINYIMTVWGVTDDIQVESCVKEFNQLCGGYSGTPLESQLLLSMLAEHTKTEKHLPMSLHEFYSAVVDRKLEVSIEEKLGVKSEGQGLGARKERHKLKSDIQTCLQWLAMTIIRFRSKENLTEQANPPNWDEDRLRRTLLVEGCGRNMFFVHRTFAEYFFGMYLANSIEIITPGQMAELSFSEAMLGVQNLFDVSSLSKYFTQRRSQIFWNINIYSPTLFGDRVFASFSKENRVCQAVILRSLLQHCDRETIIQIFELDNEISMLKFNMNEWQWSLQKLQEKIGDQFAAEIFFWKTSGIVNPTATLWHRALNNDEENGGLLYARQLWEWIRSDSCTVEKEEKVKLLLRGGNSFGLPSLLKAVRSRDSFQFFTEVLTGLSLSPERMREELMVVAEDGSNLLHYPIETTDLSLVREMLDKFLSKGDVDTLLFQGLSEVPVKIFPF